MTQVSQNSVTVRELIINVMFSWFATCISTSKFNVFQNTAPFKELSKHWQSALIQYHEHTLSNTLLSCFRISSFL